MVRNMLQVDEGRAYQLLGQALYLVKVLQQGWAGMPQHMVTGRERVKRTNKEI